ncbi:MAG: hypothetical protein U0031_21530 [Thermomicrobiales bacterium]
MSHVFDSVSRRRSPRVLAAVAAFGLALATLTGGSLSAAANHGIINCAGGGNPDNGGTMAIGCTVSGDAGVAVAGTIDVNDPALTIAGGFGGAYGAPAWGVAGVIDFDDPSFSGALGSGGSFPYAAESIAASW